MAFLFVTWSTSEAGVPIANGSERWNSLVCKIVAGADKTSKLTLALSKLAPMVAFLATKLG